MPSHIELHIQELVVQGIDPADRFLVAEAVEQELKRLLAHTDLTTWQMRAHPTGHHIDSLDGLRVAAGPDATPRHIGIHAARSIHAGLSAASIPSSSPEK